MIGLQCQQPHHQPPHGGRGGRRIARCAFLGLLLALIAGEPAAWGQGCYSPGVWQACEGGPAFDWRWIDWEGAVRRGARNSVVRGFNGTPVPEGSDSRDAWLRRRAAAEVVQYFNALGGAPSPYTAGQLRRFQQLVEQGVEDAIVEGFNRAGELKALQEREAAEKQQAEAARLPEPSVEPRRVAYDSAEVREHFGDALERAEFDRRYESARWVSAGWLMVEGNRLPVKAPAGYLLLVPRKGPGVSEVWRQRERLFAAARYARYYEEGMK